VKNLAPNGVTASGPASGVEGTAVTLTGTFADAGPVDVVTPTWVVVGSGGEVFTGAGSTFTFTPHGDGTYEGIFKSTDDEGASTEAKTSVAVANAAPSGLTLALASATIAEAGTASLSGTFGDPGSLDAHTVVIDWGDGTAPTTLALAAGVTGFTGVTHQYL